MFNFEEIDTNDFTYVSSLEQINKIESAKQSIKDIEKGLEDNLAIDMLEIDLKNIWQILGEVTGKIYTEELLDNLFKNFCVGK